MAGALLDAWLSFSINNTNLQQFGQSGDGSTYNGSTGCTHTVLQRLIKAKTGQHVTHDEISTIASYPWPKHNPRMRGLYSGGEDNEVGRVMAHYHLPYILKSNLSWAGVMAAATKGPVLIGVRYGYWPEDVGYVYHGVKADGKPGGFAFRNGKTQLRGFEKGYHAVLLLGQKMTDGTYRSYANEPNHGSASRPEKPDYDSVRSAHAARAYAQYGSTGRALLAWVPTSTFRPKGY